MENYEILPRLVSEIQAMIENLQERNNIPCFPISNGICTGLPSNYKDTKRYVNKLEREVFYMWEFIVQNGDQDEARDYLEEHLNLETPFEWE